MAFVTDRSPKLHRAQNVMARSSEAAGGLDAKTMTAIMPASD
jgi:hypothetical protein